MNAAVIIASNHFDIERRQGSPSGCDHRRNRVDCILMRSFRDRRLGGNFGGDVALGDASARRRGGLRWDYRDGRFLNGFRSWSVGFDRLIRAKPEIAVLHDDDRKGNQEKNQRDLQANRLRVRDRDLRTDKLRG